MLRGRLGRQQDAEHVDVEETVVVFLGHLLDGCEFVYAGIVDQDVELAERAHRRLDQPMSLGCLGDVPLHGDGLASVRRDRSDDGVRASLARRIVDHDGCAVLRQRLGDGRADTLRGTGDDRDLTLKL